MKILLVEDNPDLAVTTQRLLIKQNYVVDLAETLKIAKAAVLDNTYSMVLLDRMLPDGEGTDLINFMRTKGIETRVLVLSALGDLYSLIDGLDLGADDYLVKPVEPEELLARIRAAVRRPLPEAGRVISLGHLRLHTDSRNFSILDKSFMLPRRELVILERLMSNAGRVVTRETLESYMYGYDEEIQSNTLESHISRLRKNLSYHKTGTSIQTIRGVGYMLRKSE